MSATYGKHCARSDDSAILDIVEVGSPNATQQLTDG